MARFVASIDVGQQEALANSLNNACDTLRSAISKCEQGINDANDAGHNSYTRKTAEIFGNIKAQIEGQIGSIQGAAGRIPGKAREIYNQEYHEYLVEQERLARLERQRIAAQARRRRYR